MNTQPRGHIRTALVGLALVGSSLTTLGADLSRLQGILATTTEGGWAKVNLGSLSSAFPTGQDASPYGIPAQIVKAWSSVAWDSTNGQLLLWGGGHANYGGNEMYRWNSASGLWSRGSLPSALDQTDPWLPVVGNGAPVSAHTYDGNVWLSQNKMFATFGGASYPYGTPLFDSQHNPTGPWLWDPGKADPNKVGGADGTGWNPTRQGGNMWTNRRSDATGTMPTDWIHVTSAPRVEGGKDVVYLTADSYLSGFSTLYRYEVGNVGNGESDQWSVAGTMVTDATKGYTYQGASAIDSQHNLFVRTGTVDPNFWSGSPTPSDAFIVWDLGHINQGSANKATTITLVDHGGNVINFDSSASGLDFDSASGQFYLWSSKEQGNVYTTRARYDENGNLLSTWLAEPLLSTTTEQPTVLTDTGVLGKWKYVAELGAFVALENYVDATGDAAVWVYKPMSPVPEPSSGALLMLGVALLVTQHRRHQARANAESGSTRQSPAC